jgi:hypothetical protein
LVVVALVLLAWSAWAGPSVPPEPSQTGALFPVLLAAIVPGLRRRQERRRLMRAIRLGLEHHEADAGISTPLAEGSLLATTRLPV